MKNVRLSIIKFTFLIVSSVVMIAANDKNISNLQPKQMSWPNQFKSSTPLTDKYVQRRMCGLYRDMVISVNQIIKRIKNVEKSCALGYVFDEKCESLNALIFDEQDYNLKKSINFDQVVDDWLVAIIDLAKEWKGCLVNNQLGSYRVIEHMYFCAKNSLATIERKSTNLTENKLSFLKVVDAKLLEGIVGNGKNPLDLFIKSCYADTPADFFSAITLKDKFKQLTNKAFGWKEQLEKAVKENCLIAYSSFGCVRACENIIDSLREVEKSMQNLSADEKYFLTEVHEDLIFIVQKTCQRFLF